MSADNGVYILKTKDGCRVRHATAIDNITYRPDENGWNPYFVWSYFKNSPVLNWQDAYKAAIQKAEEIQYLEYGIQTLDFSAMKFPLFTEEEYSQYMKRMDAEIKEEQKELRKKLDEEYKSREIFIDGEITHAIAYGDYNGKRSS